MSIWGWLPIAVVVAALIVLATVALGTMKRAQALKTPAVSPALQRDIEALQARIATLQGEIAHVQQRVQLTQERVKSLKPAPSPPSADLT